MTKTIYTSPNTGISSLRALHNLYGQRCRHNDAYSGWFLYANIFPTKLQCDQKKVDSMQWARSLKLCTDAAALQFITSVQNTKWGLKTACGICGIKILLFPVQCYTITPHYQRPWLNGLFNLFSCHEEIRDNISQM